MLQLSHNRIVFDNSRIRCEPNYSPSINAVRWYIDYIHFLNKQLKPLPAPVIGHRRGFEHRTKNPVVIGLSELVDTEFKKCRLVHWVLSHYGSEYGANGFTEIGDATADFARIVPITGFVFVRLLSYILTFHCMFLRQYYAVQWYVFPKAFLLV